MEEEKDFFLVGLTSKHQQERSEKKEVGKMLDLEVETYDTKIEQTLNTFTLRH